MQLSERVHTHRYTLNRVTSDLWYMTGLAVGYRVLAYFLMIGFNRDKQK